MEELATRYGLHNEDRAGKKGPEIEGLAVATMNGTRYAFVASERSNYVAVYDADDPTDASTLDAASDSALAEGRIYTIDASATPARIVRARSVTEEGTAASGLDIEGLDARAGGGFWLASEGATGAGNEIIRTDSRLAIQQRIPLPTEITDHVGKWGLEGIDSAVNAKGEEVVYVALQRPLWVDPSAKPLEALEGATTNRIGRYNTVTGEWTWFGVKTTSTDADGDWIGLSELTVVDDNTLAVIERDKLNGPYARVKRVLQVTLPEEGSVCADALKPTTTRVAWDALPALHGTNGWTQEKLEGFTIAADGQAYAVTDNDGLKDATGETVFLRLGGASALFTDDDPAEAEPTAEPSEEPSAAPSTQPTTEPSTAPTTEPNEAPTAEPTSEPRSAHPGKAKGHEKGHRGRGNGNGHGTGHGGARGPWWGGHGPVWPGLHLR